MRTLICFITAVAGALAIAHLTRDYVLSIWWLFFWIMATGRSEDNA